jgi:hypothetical protein
MALEQAMTHWTAEDLLKAAQSLADAMYQHLSAAILLPAMSDERARHTSSAHELSGLLLLVLIKPADVLEANREALEPWLLPEEDETSAL